MVDVTYSPTETALFAALGLSKVLDRGPDQAYRDACAAAFLGRAEGAAVEALRRAAAAFLLDGAVRPSPGIDDAISAVWTPPEDDVLSMFG